VNKNGSLLGISFGLFEQANRVYKEIKKCKSVKDYKCKIEAILDKGNFA
jgi:hypothetical protein